MMSALAATFTSTNPFQRAKSVVGDIMEGNMAGVHLEECVSGFGFGGKWNVRGLSGKKRERKRDFLAILELGES